MPRRLLALGLAIAAALGVVLAGRIGWVAYGPEAGPGTSAAQVRFLRHALDTGGADRMQRLFPEGSFFLRALTAAAETAVPEPDLDRARALRDSLDAPESVAVFGSGMVPEHGIFAAGWSLMVAVEVARASGAPADAEGVRRRAVVVEEALRGSPSGFLAGYPGQYWPCDTVVAAASLAAAAVLLDRPDWLATVRVWREEVAGPSGPVGPSLGLLPHRVDATGAALEGPRGSSQSIIQAFWPTIVSALGERPDERSWELFRAAFVVREAGLVGVREYPLGTTGAGDVDSGPLPLGVSLSASAVTLAAARANGDSALAADLSREAELLGLPVSWAGTRRYAFGAVPVGDAFLAWARTRPLADPGTATVEPTPRPWWPLYFGVCLLPAALLAALALRRATR